MIDYTGLTRRLAILALSLEGRSQEEALEIMALCHLMGSDVREILLRCERLTHENQLLKDEKIVGRN